MTPLPRSALDFVLAREGVNLAKGDTGYSNKPYDPGKATNYGITQAAYDSYRRSGDLPTRPVRQIEYTEVLAIYERDYWHYSTSDQFADSRPRLALVNFDWGVNGGVGRARRYLQSVVGATIDGIVGPKTLAAIAAADESAAISRYLILRAAHYHLRADDAQADASAHILAQAGLSSVAPERDPEAQASLLDWLARLRWCARETGVPIASDYQRAA